MGKYEERAVELFHEGFNCSQAVFAAFAEPMNLDFDTCLRISSPIGGGVARLREVCGAVTAALMVYGYFHGNTDGPDQDAKARVYEEARVLVNEFKDEWHTIICRELLGVTENPDSTVKTAPRTAEYYQTRPCEKCIACAARIAEKYITDAAVIK